MASASRAWLVACAAVLSLGAMRAQSPSEPRGVAALRAEIAALRAPEAAWRKIPWKTCLLEGLAESRARHKPLILWVFIDRPVDDRRC